MEAKYNEKQEQIIIASEQLFAEQGFNGTSVRDIAKKANVNVAMISYYFGSKEKLLEAIFDFRITSTALHLEYLVAQKDIEPIQKLEKIIDHYTDKMLNNTCFYKIMQAQQLKSPDNRELTELIYQSKKRNYDLISALIAEGQKLGQFRKSIDISLLVSTLIGTSNQVYMGQAYYKRLNNLDHLSDERFQQLMRKRLKLFLKNSFKAILTYEL